MYEESSISSVNRVEDPGDEDEKRTKALRIQRMIMKEAWKVIDSPMIRRKIGVKRGFLDSRIP
jgi:hypothetical protein